MAPEAHGQVLNGDEGLHTRSSRPLHDVMADTRRERGRDFDQGRARLTARRLVHEAQRGAKAQPSGRSEVRAAGLESRRAAGA